MKFSRALPLFSLTLIVIAYHLLSHFGNHLTTRTTKFISNKLEPKFPKPIWSWLPTLFISTTLLLFISFWLIFQVIIPGRWSNLLSLLGIFTCIFIAWVTSVHPMRVNWRGVIAGFSLQLLFGILVSRTRFGYSTFSWISSQITIFLNYSSRGSAFVFGDAYTDHFFAFSVLPVIIFFGSATSVFYYLGIVQAAIQVLSVIFQTLMHIPACLSITASANIFVGMTEAPLLIKPFFPSLTRSEIFSVMVGGLSTIAGGVMASFILFGISPQYLLLASLMSAPASLAFSLLNYPEVEESKTSHCDQIFNILESNENQPKGLVEAAARGASDAIPLALNVGAMMLAFLPLIAFINNVVAWLFWNIGIKGLGFTKLLSWAFYPFAWLMGVEGKEILMVSELLGIKVFANEFVAYTILAGYIKNTSQNILPMISPRAELLATYALCGFGNFGSIAIIIGGLSPLSSKQARHLTDLGLRSMLISLMVCYTTACTAGFLYGGSLT